MKGAKALNNLERAAAAVRDAKRVYDSAVASRSEAADALTRASESRQAAQDALDAAERDLILTAAAGVDQ